jgi:hypothetical protein
VLRLYPVQVSTSESAPQRQSFDERRKGHAGACWFISAWDSQAAVQCAQRTAGPEGALAPWHAFSWRFLLRLD